MSDVDRKMLVGCQNSAAVAARGHSVTKNYNFSNETNSGSYLEKYQKAIVKNKNDSSFDSHRDRWERASARANGRRVHQQKMALDAQVRVYKGKAHQAKTAKKVQTKELIPWPVHTIPEAFIKVPPLDPPAGTCTSLSWTGIDFDDTDSVLFAPSVADTSTIASDIDHLFSSNDTYATVDELEWCDDLRPLEMTIPGRVPPVADANERHSPKQVVKEGSKNVAVMASQTIADQTETQEVASLTRLRQGGRQQTQAKPPEFLLMKGKLRKVKHSKNERSKDNFCTLEHHKEARGKSSTYADLVDPSSSFGDICRNTTDLTSPETFDSFDL
eukprot:CAMPEP_0178707594 /NCGR_PEP_ID=MMETSP0699-20121125/16148_1 /TAXON_ID=265572 /ORGANISM="Extubocellulus spinifer, Strain CCMP396" /LENGTH=328 /DNA_ID=CAMNT_0020355721 /DNA_START=417 /DNA_END=1399 /DNA_ORIENTATION=-